MHLAGIDWADDHHDVVIVSSSGERVHPFRIPHSGPGLKQLSEILCSLAPASELACILETRHGLLVHHLLESNFAVYPVGQSQDQNGFLRLDATVVIIAVLVALAIPVYALA